MLHLTRWFVTCNKNVTKLLKMFQTCEKGPLFIFSFLSFFTIWQIQIFYFKSRNYFFWVDSANRQKFFESAFLSQSRKCGLDKGKADSSPWTKADRTDNCIWIIKRTMDRWTRHEVHRMNPRNWSEIFKMFGPGPVRSYISQFFCVMISIRDSARSGPGSKEQRLRGFSPIADLPSFGPWIPDFE